MKYPMVDLKGQYLKIKPEIDAAIADVLENTAFIKGPAVKRFEKQLADYLQIEHVISCGNGTDALQLALMALDLQPGDEVITTSFTFIATAEVIALLKLKPVLVDVLPGTYNIDPEAVQKAITPRTKAIIPVHLFGQTADMQRIMEIAKAHQLYVIEDTAQALGADFTHPDTGKTQKAGTIGTIGCTSFFPSKNLGAYGDGGAVFTHDDQLAERLRMLANHGMKVRYYHDYVGINSRLDTLQAAILAVKLPHLDEYAQARQKAAEFYNWAFADCKKIQTPQTAPFTTHVFHQYTVVLDESIDRQALMKHLKDQGIASAVYYPVPLHLQKAYRDKRYGEGDFPVTEQLSRTVLSLPIHTEMTTDMLEEISQAVLNFIHQTL
ncbi:DegT/DnrJ/EryC1/StrS family aminotransferase [Candidatus Sulfidibacterium hydrothermale]|uniref:DegT/DnrJ/EryC1/StrS family aminotransferase n=1 Tax=Candidatus Sulfidibacterium hydrothermale TaxID=2875962 RepID=UPI001F0AF2B1|nr:DegT/DnrJ/EryC1/StrS family aminotransferase [Candidatus Sulfidibacterium hydrothermale]UBM63338.1 DegT/DnrJ/EryC1/StrS family aminotransferase [Candidatus Sulfidibacterium hydrothermale]